MPRYGGVHDLFFRGLTVGTATTLALSSAGALKTPRPIFTILGPRVIVEVSGWQERAVSLGKFAWRRLRGIVRL